MKTNKLAWIGLFLIALGLFFCFYRIYKVNDIYPKTQEKEVAKGIYYEIGSKIEMCVLDARWLDGAELQSEYGDSWYVEEPSDYKAVEVKIKVRNLAGKKKKVALFKTYIESEQYDWNGSDAELFVAKNNMPLEIELESGQELECVMPYTFLKETYKECDWEKLNEIPYFLVRDRYPQKVKWKI